MPLLHRRNLLKGLASTPLAGAALAGDVAASTSTESIQVSQGDATYEVEPLSYRDWTVEEFYSYGSPDGASANTPTNLERSDVSRLFFYEGPGGLSLVIIHDRPNDGDGGSVEFQFDTLPQGNWVVPDDSGEPFSRSHADWGWAPCCTDGGAFRGSFGDSVTLTPAFQSGIGEWELLSGDAADPTVHTLDRGTPITVSPGGTSPGSFAAVRDQKLALAGSIDGVAQNIQERPRVEATLDDLGARIEAGDLPEDEAVAAVERMLLGENVTQAAITGLGPVGDDGEYHADEFDNRVDTPTGIEGLDIAKKTVNSVIATFVDVLLSGTGLKAAKKALPGWASGVIDDAIAWLDETIRAGVDAIVGAYTSVATRMGDETATLADDLEHFLRNFGEQGKEDAAKAGGKKLFDAIAQIEEPIANLIVGLLETTTPDNVDDALSDLDADLGGDGSIDSSGSLDEAVQEAQAGLDEMYEQLDGARRAIEFLDVVTKTLDILALVAGLMYATGILAIGGAATQLAVTVVNTLFHITSSLVGIGTLENTVDTHNEALAGVVNPR